MTHTELKAKALADPEVMAEYERLNREEFAILDEILYRPDGVCYPYAPT